MGNVTIATDETAIYYPSDWLIEGGPPFEVADCPKYVELDDVQPLEVIYNKANKMFGLTQGDFVVMESRNAKDVAKYVTDYIEGFQNWVEENT